MHDASARRLARGRAGLLRFAAMLLFVALAGAACGVRFRDASAGNEFFKSLTIVGDRRAGVPLVASVSYAQTYPLEVQVTCELRQGKQLVREIGTATIPRLPGGTPKSTPAAGQQSYDFVVDAPGRYKLECFTPADQDNYINKEFSIS